MGSQSQRQDHFVIPKDGSDVHNDKNVGHIVNLVKVGPALILKGGFYVVISKEGPMYNNPYIGPFCNSY